MTYRPFPMRWILTICLVFPFLILVGGYVWVHQANNAAARALEAQLQELPVPAETQVVDTAWVAQRLAGTGNGMQYAGALLVRSGLSEAELSDWYAGQAGSPTVLAADDPRLGRSTMLFHTTHDLTQPGLFFVMRSGEPTSEVLRQVDLRGH